MILRREVSDVLGLSSGGWWVGVGTKRCHTRCRRQASVGPSFGQSGGLNEEERPVYPPERERRLSRLRAPSVRSRTSYTQF
jgi:hypothetical protein